jgi:hypothetical protein
MGGQIGGLILIWWPGSGGSRVLGVRVYAFSMLCVSGLLYMLPHVQGRFDERFVS